MNENEEGSKPTHPRCPFQIKGQGYIRNFRNYGGAGRNSPNQNWI